MKDGVYKNMFVIELVFFSKLDFDFFLRFDFCLCPLDSLVCKKITVRFATLFKLLKLKLNLLNLLNTSERDVLVLVS